MSSASAVGVDANGVGEAVTEAIEEDPAGGGMAVADATLVSKTGPDEIWVAVAAGVASG